MKKKIAFTLAVLFVSTSLFANIEKIKFKKLPQNTQEFIELYFPKQQIKSSTVDTNDLNHNYYVKLKNGTEFTFNSKGDWTKIDCGDKAVPEGIVPEMIMKMITQKDSEVFVIKITTNGKTHKLKCSNDKEYVFASILFNKKEMDAMLEKFKEMKK